MCAGKIWKVVDRSRPHLLDKPLENLTCNVQSGKRKCSSCVIFESGAQRVWLAWGRCDKKDMARLVECLDCNVVMAQLMRLGGKVARMQRISDDDRS